MNSVYEDLVKAGPDAFGNMFDCYILYTNKNKERKFITPKSSDYKDGYGLRTEFQNMKSFATRIESIEIPSIYLSTEEVSYGGISVAVASHKQEYTNVSKISVRLDQDLYVLDMMDTLSSTNIPKLQASAYNVNTNMAFARLSSHSNLTRENLSIIVRRSAFNLNKKSLNDETYLEKKSIDGWLNTEDSAFVSSPRQMNQWFVFEGVYFYGSEDNISFSEKSDNNTKTYSFTFKNLFFLNSL